MAEGEATVEKQPYFLKNSPYGSSLAVQWLGFRASTAGEHGFDPLVGDLTCLLLGTAKKKKKKFTLR